MGPTYSYYDQCYPKTYSRRCIDGSTVNCSKCVGYCQYKGHEGFLTEKHQKEHDCLTKKCFYYLSRTTTKKKHKSVSRLSTNPYSRIAHIFSRFEGLGVVSLEQQPDNSYLLKYITLSNTYDIPQINQESAKALGADVTMIRLNYDFDTIAQLLFM